MGNSESSGGGGGGGGYAHDVKTQSGLTSIYNDRVVSAQKVTRTMDSSGGKNIPGVKHEGVR